MPRVLMETPVEHSGASRRSKTIKFPRLSTIFKFRTIKHLDQRHNQTVLTSHLNPDILFIMMRLLSTRDLLACMLTCHVVYNLGLPLLGRKARFDGESWPHYDDPPSRFDLFRSPKRPFRHKIDSFIRFIRVDAPVRGSHLRDLYIRLPVHRGVPHGIADSLLQIPQGIADGILHIIETCRLIESLDIIVEMCVGSSRHFIENHPRIPEAISSLKHLKRLSVGINGSQGCRMMREMQSPLVVADLRFEFQLSRRVEDYVDILSLLSRFCSSLKVLYLEDSEITAEDIVFPNVEELCVEGNYPNKIGPLIRSFPNLRRCQLGAMAKLSRREAPPDMLVAFAKNIVAQENIYWNELDYLAGYLESILTYSPRSRVRHLRVLIPFQDYSFEALPAIVHHAQPLCLELDVRIESVEALTQFVEHPNTVAILSELIPTETIFFRFVVSGFFIVWRVEGQIVGEDLSPVIASQLLPKPSSSLQYICVEVKEYPPRLWRIERPAERDDGLPIRAGTRLVEMPHQRAEHIMEEQGFAPQLHRALFHQPVPTFSRQQALRRFYWS